MPVPAGWAYADAGQSYSLGELAGAFAVRASHDDPALLEWQQQIERASDQELIARCQRGENWHNSMIALTARMVWRGQTDAEILAIAQSIKLDDFSDDQTRAELRVAIDGAREKWPAEQPASDISATPFIQPDSCRIPPRPWVLGRWLLRGTVTTVIAPGGVGKSALMVAAALSLASGHELLGKTVWGGPKRVWLRNLEDDWDELARQIVGCCWHHEIFASEYAGHLFVNDASAALCTAIKGRDGLVIDELVHVQLVAEISSRQIDVLIIDPFVSSHRAEENDNGQIDAIAKRWASIARETNCSIVLVHHSRKLAGQQVDAESARGASALGNAARSVLVLNRMEKGEATKFGISEEDRRGYIRVNNDKANRAPAGEADWFRLVSVRLANGGPEGGDSIGVIERWTPPDATVAAESFDDAIRIKVQAAITADEWRENHMSKDWAGYAVAEIFGADISIPADKHRIKALLADMLAKGQIRIVKRLDASRHMKDFIVMGEPITESCGSPAW